MPDNPIAGLYPAPPPPQQNALASNPLAFIPAIQGMQRFNADKAVGSAFQGAVGSNGSFDPAAAALAIKGNPDAALSAPGAITSLLAARGQNITNSTAALNLGVANNSAAANIFAQIAQKANPTMEDVYNLQAQAVRAGIDPQIVAGWGAGINPKNIKQRIGEAANYAMGAGGSASRTVGPIGPNGEPTTVPIGATTTAGGAMQTGFSPVQQADLAEYQADQEKSSKTLASVRPLQQALPLVEKLGDSQFGPASPEWTKAKATLASLGIIDPKTNDTDVRQEVGKYLLQYASNAQAAGRSDQALSAAMGSNPNPDTMVRPAVINLLKNRIGMDLQDAAIPSSAGAWNGYKNFKSSYYQATDPRAFQPMTPEETTALVKAMKPEERTKFIRSWNIAHPNGAQ